MVEFDHAVVGATHDQERRGARFGEHVAGEIGPAAAQDDGGDTIAELSRCDERGCRAGARSEEAERQLR
jgi:hypothetical protein